MRQPQLYDFVYINKYGRSLFQVIGINQNPLEKYPTFEVLNVATMKDADILCPISCEMDEIYGVPLADIEFHFLEGETWHWFGDDPFDFDDEDDKDYDKDITWIVYGDYTLDVKGTKWELDFDGQDPQPLDIEHIHELQQYHRGFYGDELDVFGKFNPMEWRKSFS